MLAVLHWTTAASRLIWHCPATVKGFWGSKVSQQMPVETKRRLVGELLTRVMSGELALPVQAIYELADAAEAAKASLKPGKNGKVLLRP